MKLFSKNKAETITEDATQLNITSEQSTVKKSAKKLSFKRIAVLCLTFVLLAGATFVAYELYINAQARKNIALKVGDTVITKDDYRQMLEEYKKYTEPKIKDQVALKAYVKDTLRTKAALSKLGYPVEESMKDSVAASIFNNEGKPKTSYQLIVAEAELNARRIKQVTEGQPLVANIYVPFSKNFIKGQQEPPKTFGNKQAIEEDIAKAKAKIADYRARLTKALSEANAKSITDELKNETDLTSGYTKNHSAVFYLGKDGKVFDNTRTLNVYLGEEDVAVIFKTPKGLSEVLTRKTSANLSPVSGYTQKGVDMAYYFYAIIDKPQADPSFKNKVEDSKKDVMVVDNV